MKRFAIKKHHPESGMSLLELMFAGFVLTVGMLGALVMITTAIQSNSRNKYDSTGTMVAQLVLEHQTTMPTNQTDVAGALVTSIPVTDCETPTHSPKTWSVAVGGADVASGGAGAKIDLSSFGTNPNYGNIDWTQDAASVPAGYIMYYYSCGDVTWEARWNIQQVSNLAKLITVSARHSGTETAKVKSGMIFAPPVTLRTINGP